MGRKSKFTIEDKIQACEQYLNGEGSYATIATHYGADPSTIKDWVKRYQEFGSIAFLEKEHNRSYSKELKQEVIDAYFNGEASLKSLAVKYGIGSHLSIIKWIAKYNNSEELTDYDPKPEVYMAEKRRKTTVEERVEIVNYCLEHNKDYKGTASLYDVSYAQVYQWVGKFLESGEEGLADNRGRRKQEEDLDETEKLRRKVKLLEMQLKEVERENVLLKKVKEIERRRSSLPQGTKRNI